jgi:hypothetical protein
MATATPTKKPAAKGAAPKKDASATTSVAVRKASAGAVVNIKEALKAQAAAMGERTQPAGGNKIRLGKGKFTLPDGTEAVELQLVIVDFRVTHDFYPGKFDPKNIVPPACFAIGINPKQMTPSANAPEPQCDSCQTCPMNEFGSSGDGKACKNGRALAVLPPEADENTDLWLLDVSPTALKNFDGFVNSVARLYDMPPVGVIATVTMDPNVDYPKLVFSDPQPNDKLAVHFARQGEAKEMLETEPDVTNYVSPNKAPAGRKPAVKNARR